MSKMIKYQKYVPVLREIISIAGKRTQRDQEEGYMDFNLSDLSQHHDPVYDYLMKQDMETVKIVQTVMYIGRDYQYPEKTDEELDRELEMNDYDYTAVAPQIICPVANPDALIDDTLADLTRSKGWMDKEIEAHQISGKKPLARYLHRAFEILDI